MSKLSKGILKIKRRLHKNKKAEDKETIRWGVIGLGTMAEWFTCALECVPEASVVAVASRNNEKANKFAKKHGIRYSYGSYEEMLCDEKLKLDVIYIATPHKFHYEHIKLCLNKGHNVICEKPITSNTDELKELIKLAHDKNLFFMEGMWMKCLPTYQKGLEWVRNGKIGDLQWIRVDFSKNEVIDSNKTIFNKEDGGGVLMDYGIYALTFPLDFMNERPEITSFNKRFGNSGIDKDWHIMLTDSHIKAFINISSNFEGDKKAILIGNKGTIEWMPQFNRTNCIKLYDENGKLIQTYKEKYIYDGFEYEIQEVHRCLKENKIESTIVPLGSSLNTLELVDKLMKG